MNSSAIAPAHSPEAPQSQSRYTAVSRLIQALFDAYQALDYEQQQACGDAYLAMVQAGVSVSLEAVHE